MEVGALICVTVVKFCVKMTILQGFCGSGCSKVRNCRQFGCGNAEICETVVKKGGVTQTIVDQDGTIVDQ